MEFHCGNCNAPLPEAALDSGVCPQCGAQISPFGDVIETPQRTQIVPGPGEPPAAGSPVVEPATLPTDAVAGATVPTDALADAHPPAAATAGNVPPLAPVPGKDPDGGPAEALAASWPTVPFAPPLDPPTVVTPAPPWPRFAPGPLQDTQTRLQTVRASRTTGRLADPVGPKALHVPPAGLLAGIAVAIFMVLLCTIAATSSLLRGFTGVNLGTAPTQVSGNHITPGPTQPTGLGFPTQNPNPTPLPFNQVTPTFVPTSTPYGGPPTPTPQPSPTVTPVPSATSSPSTPPPTSPIMSVNPTQIHMACPGTDSELTLANTGGGTLNWQATASDPSITLNPASGSQDAGQPPQSITVTATLPSSAKSTPTVTFTDQDGGEAPVSVQIACK